MSACLSDTRTSAAGSPYSCRQGRPRLIMRVATLISFSLRPNVGGCKTRTPSATQKHPVCDALYHRHCNICSLHSNTDIVRQAHHWLHAAMSHWQHEKPSAILKQCLAWLCPDECGITLTTVCWIDEGKPCLPEQHAVQEEGAQCCRSCRYCSRGSSCRRSVSRRSTWLQTPAHSGILSDQFCLL